MHDRINLTHAETVRLSLEQDIFSGKLLPGSPLDEENLASRFSVSRTPVREAVLQLVQSGLVDKQPRRGAVVARMDIRRLIQQFELVSELEAMCARLATRRMSEQEKQALAECHTASVKALENSDEDAYHLQARRFHLLIARGSHNEALIETTNKASLPLLPYRRFQNRYPGRPRGNLDDHEQILNAILQRADEEAGNLFRRHTTMQGDVLAEYVSLGN